MILLFLVVLIGGAFVIAVLASDIKPVWPRRRDEEDRVKRPDARREDGAPPE